MRNNLTLYVDLLKHVFSGNNTADRETTRQTIKQETEKIGTSLARTFYQTDSESKQRAFVHNLHARLVRLSDYFCETVRKNDEEPPPEISGPDNGQQLVLSTLQDVIDSVCRDYPALYDQNQKITGIHARGAVTGEIKEKLESLSMPAGDPEHRLFEEVKASVGQCFEKTVITYGLINYLCAFIRDIEESARMEVKKTILDMLQQASSPM